MAIVLDTTTKAEYDALTLASARASLVVSALSGTVVVEVFDGTDAIRASGTMAAPWATSSGATITVGEINATGLLVTSGGAPTADWYCQFRSGTRFLRGTFGVLGSGRDFVWSLASFETGSRGTLGTVAMVAQGESEPVNTSAPVITGSVQVGATLTLGVGTWTESPVSYARQLQQSDNGSTAWSDVSGATGATYVVATALLGKYLRLRVVATNTAADSSPAYSSVTSAVAAAGNSARIYSSDLTYLGSFRVPSPDPTGGTFSLSGFAGTRTGMAYNPAGNGGLGSLFLVCGGDASVSAKYVAEISIPSSLSTSGVLASLPRATTLQNFADPTEGQWSEISPLRGDLNYIVTRGLHVHNGRLVICAYDFYDASNLQVKSHFSRPLNLSTTGDVKGAVAISSSGEGIRFSVGGMCAVPSAVQSTYGIDPVISGGGGGSIMSSLSAGPTAYAFDPDDIGVTTISAQNLLSYPNATGGVAQHLPALFGYMLGDKMPASDRAVANPYWLPSSFASVTAWLEARPVVLYVGRHGLGEPWYGTTNSSGYYVSGAGGAGNPPGYDPAFKTSTGDHAYPYNLYFWAYDQSELIAVKQGTKDPWEATPYAVWAWASPFTPTDTQGTVTGSTHDVTGRRIFIAEYGVDAASGYGTNPNYPIIHVLQYPAS